MIINQSSPDSIPDDVNCTALQEMRPAVCCDIQTGDFCPVQCMQGVCRCVDTETGEAISDMIFTQEENIDCNNLPTLPTLTEAPGTTS